MSSRLNEKPLLWACFLVVPALSMSCASSDGVGDAPSSTGANGIEGATSGLVATYFDNKDFTGPTVERIDPVVDFNWGRGSPANEIGKDTFSVRWLGFVEAEHSETYTFHTVSDDGIRLWVDGKLIVENWTLHGSTENRGSIELEAGKRYPIKMEYFENGGGAVAKLKWSSPSVTKQTVPANRLFPQAEQGDLCPEDPKKTAPGICGCGTPDMDSDGDLSLDCEDLCPSDPDKVQPGACGCGVSDIDSNSDGVLDCREEGELVCGALNASVDTSKEKYANKLCGLCKDSELPPNERLDRYVDSKQKTCGNLAFEMFRVTPGSNTCHEMQRDYRETCCNTECTPPPAIEQEWEPVDLPFPEGRFPACDLCRPADGPSGQYPLKPNSVASIASVPGNPSCVDLYWMGRTHHLPAALCYPIQSFMKEACGCAPPDPQDRPRGDEPWCDVCPGGQFPLRPGAFLNDFPGNPMCRDLYWMGRTGNISSEMCQQVNDKAQDACGCLPAE